MIFKKREEDLNVLEQKKAEILESIEVDAHLKETIEKWQINKLKCECVQTLEMAKESEARKRSEDKKRMPTADTVIRTVGYLAAIGVTVATTVLGDRVYNLKPITMFKI